MEEYLTEHGHTFEDLGSLEQDVRERLVLEAEAYAALRLCERAYSE